MTCTDLWLPPWILNEQAFGASGRSCSNSSGGGYWVRESLAFLMRVSSTARLSSGLCVENSLRPVFLLFFHSTNTVSADHAAGVGLGPGHFWESSGRQNAVSTVLGPRAQWKRQGTKPLLSNVDGRAAMEEVEVP